MKIKSIRKIKPEPARCIEVDSPDRLFAAGGTDGHSIVSHNSVVQRNIIFSTILRPDSWRFLGVDLKKVELSSFRAYSNVVLGIATTVEDALTVLRFAQQTMMKRYAEMEQLGVNNFLDLPEKGQGLLVMIDEAGELLSPSGVKALVGSTIIPIPEGFKKLEELEIGDTVFDNFGNETKIIIKYEPTQQSRYEMLIKSDESGISETFVAGSEHNWVPYFVGPDGSVSEPEILDTTFLYNFKLEQDSLPASERTLIKFKKSSQKVEQVSSNLKQLDETVENLMKLQSTVSRFSEEEWFTLEDIAVSDNFEKLYCIGVDAPEKQFLIGEKIAVPTHNTEDAKAEDELKGEASMILGSIARLGRAAGVHLIVATQRPDAKIISGETKANLGVRINCGRTDSNASGMILGTGEGTRVKANPRGRLYLRIYGSGNHGQGFYAEQNWIDEYLAAKGLNQDGTPIGNKKSKLANVVDMSQFESGDLDSREGVDNSKVIEKIRNEESGEEFDEVMEDSDVDDDDWGFGDLEEDLSEDEDKLGRPELLGTDTSMDKFHRPEEDWDNDLEDLINDNNN